MKSVSSKWFTEAAPYAFARLVWLRALGLIFFSAFYSLWFQIHGLIGPTGILPARDYLLYAKQVLGARAYWWIPSLLWIDAGRGMLTAIVVIGAIASLLIVFGVFTRTSIAVTMVCFLSFVAAAQDFSSYQSDGMLLEAAFFSLLLGNERATAGGSPAERPASGRRSAEPPTRAAVFMLQWLWFRIYFESGLVKILSGEEQWRNLTAMDKYYENGPLPTWIGWYVQHWPHAFHAFSAGATLVVELLVVWLLFVPSRKAKLLAFAITTPLQLGIILTANYAFLNYEVLALGFLLIEDNRQPPTVNRQPLKPQLIALPLAFVLTILTFVSPIRLLAPFRIINNYGLFAVMTRARFELEFQGTRDGRTWIAYPFRYKPQSPMRAPGIYAPYQPRFEWNLWFASLGTVSDNPWVMATQERLLANDRDVLSLFASNPFRDAPPKAVRVVTWRYWFTSAEERARTGAWWNRELLGEYAPRSIQSAP